MSSPIETGSSEDVTSINIRDDTDNSQWITTGMISDGSITAQSKYDGTNVRATKTIYYASHKLLDDLDDPTTYSWAVSDDADTVAQLANGWIDGAAEVTRVTYTKTATAEGTLSTTNDFTSLSSYIGAACDQGYVTVFMRFSDFSNVTKVQCQIGDTDSSYRYVDIDVSQPSNSWGANDIWYGLTFDLENEGHDVGTPDGGNVEWVAFVFTFADGAAKTVDLKDLYVSGVNYATTADETSYKVSGSDFDSIRQQTLVLTYEGKTIVEQYVFESENETAITKSISGGY